MWGWLCHMTIPDTLTMSHDYSSTHSLCSTRTEKAYEAGYDADQLQEQDKNNSIFVSALKEHLQRGTLNERLDTLFSDAAARVRDRGKKLNTAANGWMRPEIRHNMAGPLSLADEIKRGPEADSLREERAQLWRTAHSEWGHG